MGYRHLDVRRSSRCSILFAFTRFDLASAACDGEIVENTEKTRTMKKEMSMVGATSKVTRHPCWSASSLVLVPETARKVRSTSHSDQGKAKLHFASCGDKLSTNKREHNLFMDLP